jgi:hypothetical protein
MRPNNTDSLITAAHRRRELTRAKAIQTIRELDHAGTRLPSRPSLAPAKSRAHGCIPSPTYAPRSNASATPPNRRHHPQSPPASAPQTPLCGSV